MTDNSTKLTKELLIDYWYKFIDSPYSYVFQHNDVFGDGYKIYLSHKVFIHVFTFPKLDTNIFYIQLGNKRFELSFDEAIKLIEAFPEELPEITINEIDHLLHS